MAKNVQCRYSLWYTLCTGFLRMYKNVQFYSIFRYTVYKMYKMYIVVTLYILNGFSCNKLAIKMLSVEVAPLV